MTTALLERTLFRLLPAGVLLVVFVGLCVMTGTAWPWNQVVHEDGVRTLLRTVFYVEHGTRELLPDALLALAVAGSVAYFFPLGRAEVRDTLARSRRRLAWVVAAMFTVIVGGTLWTEGGHVLIDNLSQSHTRAGAPLVWGAHWRYHLIERFAQMMLAFSASGVFWMLHGKPRTDSVPGRSRLFGASLFLFVAITVVFRLTSEPFRDPAYLGHQLRELFTHSLVTLPLALGTCLALARKYSLRSPGTSPGASADRAWPIVVAGASAVLSGAFLLVASVMADAQSHGQTEGLASLLFPHFAEHALGYVLVPALAGLTYLTPRRPPGRHGL
jgi:hypothetical protein